MDRPLSGKNNGTDSVQSSPLPRFWAIFLYIRECSWSWTPLLETSNRLNSVLDAIFKTATL